MANVFQSWSAPSPAGLTQSLHHPADPDMAVQAIVCMCLSVAHGANNARTSVGVFSMMLAVHNTRLVPETIQLKWAWRIMPAVGMTLGTLFLGFRLTPVAGEASQLAVYVTSGPTAMHQVEGGRQT